MLALLALLASWCLLFFFFCVLLLLLLLLVLLLLLLLLVVAAGVVVAAAGGVVVFGVFSLCPTRVVFGGEAEDRTSCRHVLRNVLDVFGTWVTARDILTV